MAASIRIRNRFVALILTVIEREEFVMQVMAVARESTHVFGERREQNDPFHQSKDPVGHRDQQTQGERREEEKLLHGVHRVTTEGVRVDALMVHLVHRLVEERDCEAHAAQQDAGCSSASYDGMRVCILRGYAGMQRTVMQQPVDRVKVAIKPKGQRWEPIEQKHEERVPRQI